MWKLLKAYVEKKSISWWNQPVQNGQTWLGKKKDFFMCHTMTSSAECLTTKVPKLKAKS